MGTLRFSQVEKNKAAQLEEEDEEDKEKRDDDDDDDGSVALKKVWLFGRARRNKEMK